jgi:hypothetical protein
MLNVPRLSCVWSVLICLFVTLAAPAAKAQSPALTNQLSRIDFGVSGIGVFNGSGSGVPPSGPVTQTVTLQTSNTVGALITLRYIKSPLVGFEGNYTYARYTENFNPLGAPVAGAPVTGGGIQTNASEYTIGYVVHTPDLFNVHPFVAVGAGTTAFRPTIQGGQQLNTQARATYYYSIGAESTFSPHFGVRAQFRQAFFLAPDFGQNYLTINHRTSTYEPGIGFFFRF